MNNTKIKAILFDFDGTLVDSEHSRFESSKRILKKFDFDLTDELWESKYKALSSKELFEDMIEKLNLSITSDELYFKAHELRTRIEKEEGVKVIDGFREFYEQCKKLDLKCIVCSGGTSEHVQRVLKQCKIDIAGFGREEYDKRKPAPDAWICGMKKLNVKPDEVLLFDDASTGIIAGLRAGIEKCCAINYDKEDFTNIEKYEEETRLKVFKYFNNWREVEIDKLIKE